MQWLTAGRGIVHSEMFPLLDQDGPNPLELFQIWLNLASDDKLADPHFSMLWADDIPRVLTTTDVDGRTATTEVTVIAGAWRDTAPPPPPPNSWAARASSEVAIWHLRLESGARGVCSRSRPTPTRRERSTRSRVVTPWSRSVAMREAREPLALGMGAVVAADAAIELVGAAEAVDAVSEVLVLQGRPIGERVAQYGPFVMNDEAGIEQAIQDYRTTGFGGWPWPTEELVHGADPTPFAVRPDGRLERA